MTRSLSVCMYVHVFMCSQLFSKNNKGCSFCHKSCYLTINLLSLSCNHYDLGLYVRKYNISMKKLCHIYIFIFFPSYFRILSMLKITHIGRNFSGMNSGSKKLQELFPGLVRRPGSEDPHRR